jgi:hypothetical protein
MMNSVDVKSRTWRGQKAQANKSRRLRPTVMALEGRALLSTFTVNNTAGEGRTGTPSWAIGQANVRSGADTITVSSLFHSPQTITLIGGSRARAGGGLFNAVRAPPEEQPSRAVHEWVADVVRPRERAGPSTEFD